MREYQDVKTQISTILTEVKMLNKEEEDDGDVDYDIAEEEEAPTQGDVLSRLMRGGQ